MASLTKSLNLCKTAAISKSPAIAPKPIRRSVAMKAISKQDELKIQVITVPPGGIRSLSRL